MIAVSAAQRPALYGAILREIVDADQAAVPGHVICDPAGDRAAIESVGAVLGDDLQSRRIVAVDETISGLRYFAVRQVDAGRGPVLLEEPAAFRNRRRQGRIELVAALGIFNRRRDEVAPRNFLARVVAIEEIEARHDSRDIRGRCAIAGARRQQRIVTRRPDRDLIFVVDGNRLCHALQIEHSHAVAADP